MLQKRDDNKLRQSFQIGLYGLGALVIASAVIFGFYDFQSETYDNSTGASFSETIVEPTITAIHEETLFIESKEFEVIPIISESTKVVPTTINEDSDLQEFIIPLAYSVTDTQLEVTIDSWSILPIQGPSGIQVTEEEKVWFIGRNDPPVIDGKIAMLDPSTNELTEWFLGEDIDPELLTLDGDGNIWVGFEVKTPEFFDPVKIGRLEPGTNIFTEWELPINGFEQNFVSDADGNLWFTFSGNSIGKFDPNENLFTFWERPELEGYGGIVVDFDGNVWAISDDDQFRSIDRLNPNTNEVTRWEIDINNCECLVGDSLGNIFFLNKTQIIRLNPTTNVFTTWNTPNPEERAFRISIDNNDIVYWGHFGDIGGIGRLVPSTNIMTLWTVDISTNIAFSPSNDLWFGESEPGVIKRMY